jgi:hypothetical protein
MDAHKMSISKFAGTKNLRSPGCAPKLTINNTKAIIVQKKGTMKNRKAGRFMNINTRGL